MSEGLTNMVIAKLKHMGLNVVAVDNPVVEHEGKHIEMRSRKAINTNIDIDDIVNEIYEANKDSDIFFVYLCNYQYAMTDDYEIRQMFIIRCANGEVNE